MTMAELQPKDTGQWNHQNSKLCLHLLQETGHMNLMKRYWESEIWQQVLGTTAVKIDGSANFAQYQYPQQWKSRTNPGGAAQQRLQGSRPGAVFRHLKLQWQTHCWDWSLCAATVTEHGGPRLSFTPSWKDTRC